jgi:hypothetical protein
MCEVVVAYNFPSIVFVQEYMNIVTGVYIFEMPA